MTLVEPGAACRLWTPNSDLLKNVANIPTPGTYNFGGFNSGASKTMKFQIRRG